ncbi:MAG: GTPase HflX [Calditrichia bacterium]
MKLYETEKQKETALLIGVLLPGISPYDVEDHLDELEQLCMTAGAEVIGKIIQERKVIDSAYFIGKGKAREIGSFVEENNITLVIFDDDLSPAQSRNLEKVIKAKIIDRSALILDIFASHARSREAKTQVELAQLQYMLPRLTRQWTHLSRQVGGIGTKGPGETQLETDRRLVRTRISHLKDDLRKIEHQRHVRRRGREELFNVALIGYTNAGKSTLMKLLTNANVKVEDQLFATLDSTVRKLRISKEREILLSDTVGFIRKLPHHLVASFRSTLEEAREADLLLHVIDISHPSFREHISVVHQVLKEMEIEEKKMIYVFNKIDMLPEEKLIFHLKKEYEPSVFISAVKNMGIRKLIKQINTAFDSDLVVSEWKIPVQEMGKRHLFLKYGNIIEEKIIDDQFYKIITSMLKHQYDKFLKEFEHLKEWSN